MPVRPRCVAAVLTHSSRSGAGVVICRLVACLVSGRRSFRGDVVAFGALHAVARSRRRRRRLLVVPNEPSLSALSALRRAILSPGRPRERRLPTIPCLCVPSAPCPPLFVSSSSQSLPSSWSSSSSPSDPYRRSDPRKVVKFVRRRRICVSRLLVGRWWCLGSSSFVAAALGKGGSRDSRVGY